MFSDQCCILLPYPINHTMEPEKQYEFSAVLSSAIVQEIGRDLRRVEPTFDEKGFVGTIVPQLDGKLIKERGQCIAEAMRQYLPENLTRAIALLTESMGPKLGDAENMGSAFKYWPHGAFVSEHGTAPDQFEGATHFLYEMTQRFSAEFAIRPFLVRYPERMLGLLERWSKDESQHVRRLVSEGTRPRLPWGSRIKVYDADYAPIWALLYRLHDDPELYVRRSVANHLNDLTKDRPGQVLDHLETWQKTPSPYLDWVTRHALRSLIKAGHPRALALLGYQADAAIRLVRLELASPQLSLGEKQEITLELVSESKESQPLMIDYLVYYKKANGELKPKVFKWKTVTLSANDGLVLTKKHVFKPFSTRRVYAGEHQVAIQVNGRILGRVSFELVFP